MELPRLGQHCSHTHCKQLDFLPLPCKCNQQFCSEHFHAHIQTCPNYIDNKVEPRKIENVYKCSQISCNETSIVPLICERCNQHFCIRHRHFTTCSDKDPQQIAVEKEKYAAPVRQFNQVKTVIDQQIERKLENQRKQGKNVDMVNKIQLMKIKSKANGLKTIPQCDRIYFNTEYSNKIAPVFVSKQWTIGRCIDAIAEEMKLQNDNNKSFLKKLVPPPNRNISEMKTSFDINYHRRTPEYSQLSAEDVPNLTNKSTIREEFSIPIEQKGQLKYLDTYMTNYKFDYKINNNNSDILKDKIITFYNAKEFLPCTSANQTALRNRTFSRAPKNLMIKSETKDKYKPISPYPRDYCVKANCWDK